MPAATMTRTVDAYSARLLREARDSLTKFGNDSVQAGWRFGQMLDSMSDRYNRAQLAECLGYSEGTVYKYVRFYMAYQRPELALEAARKLETFNIGTLIDLANDLNPVEHGRPLRGRKFHYTCRSCGSHEVGRDEITGEDEDEQD